MKYTTSGFTLLELAIVITVLTILAVATMPQIAEDYNRTRTHLTIGEIESFSEAARLYAHNNKGAWPDAPGCAGAIKKLKDGGYLQGVDEISPWTTRYDTSGCTNKLFTIKTDVTEQYKDWAGVILNAVHSTDYYQGKKHVVRTNVVLPGGVPATERLLHRYDEGNPELNRMDTAINMDGNDLQKVRDITSMRDITSVRDITLMGKIVDGDDTRHYLDPDQKSEMRNLELSTLKATHMRTQYGYAEQGTTGSYGYVAYDGRNNQNRDPKSEVGSVNVNDIWLRSGGNSGEWLSERLSKLSEMDNNTYVLLSMWMVVHRDHIYYPADKDCRNKGGEAQIVLLPGGYHDPGGGGEFTPSVIRVNNLDEHKAWTTRTATGWRIYFEEAITSRGLAQVYCAY